MEDCVFCRIASGHAPARIVYGTETTLAFFPLYPATPGHTLVIPKKHVDNFLELSPDDIPDLGNSVLHVGQILRSALQPEGMNVISSAGQAATQTIMHLHIHLVPRWCGDEMGDIWPHKNKTLDIVLDDMLDRIQSVVQK